jgi:large subunit ribosomal protein L32e
MVINEELLQARKKVAHTRPKFVRQESWRYDRLAESWRRPKGKDNKMRRQLSGAPRLVKIGYRGPKKARGLHPSGYTDNLVFNVRDLGRLDPAGDAARIGHAVGQRKRLLILAEARSRGIKVLNPGKEQKAEEAPEIKGQPSVKKKTETNQSTEISKELRAEDTGDEEEAEEGELDLEVEEDDKEKLKANENVQVKKRAKADEKPQEEGTKERKDRSAAGNQNGHKPESKNK